MTEHMWHMAAMGLLVSVAAPAVVLVVTRWAPRLDRGSAPAAVALPGFVLLHFAVTAASGHTHRATIAAAAHGALFLAALLFWAPVFGARRRISDAARTVYVYTAMPLLDLAGVWLVAVGDVAGGLAMIVGMLPMGLIAVAVTWEWIGREQRRAVAAETGPRPHRDGAPAWPSPSEQGDDGDRAHEGPRR